MRFQDLSPADQQLMRTDFGEMDKIASAQVAHAQECYDYGYTKLAEERISAQYEAEESEKVASMDEHEDLDDEAEKTAAESGAFTEKGDWDRLIKEGQEQFGDALYFVRPMLEEKIAMEGARIALEKFAGKVEEGMKALRGAGKYVAGKGTEAAHAMSPKSIKKDWANKGRDKMTHHVKAVAKGSAYVAGAGGLAYGGKKGYDAVKKK